MQRWELVGCSEALEEFEENPRLGVISEEQLREELLKRQQSDRHVVLILDSDLGDGLSFSLGGPFASLGWQPALDPQRSQGNKEAMPQERVTDEAVKCWGEGIPNWIEPDYLHPAEQVIEAIVHFYNTHQLPDWFNWREWNPVSMQWQMARKLPTQASAS
jgi:hypothetical protein